MLKPNDDLFACGCHEPSAATVCNVVGVDDLIILGIVAAASIAASQISASDQEGYAKDEAGRKRDFQNQQAVMDYNHQKSQRAAQQIQSVYGVNPGDPTDKYEPWRNKLAIDAGYDSTMRGAERQADATRMNGYIQAGSTLASGIAGQALKAPSPSFEAGAAYGGTGADIAQRAGQYDLNPASSGLLSGSGPVSTPQIHPSDVPSFGVNPGNGFQLSQDDYGLLMGDQNPYTNANPNRFRFGL